MRVRLLQGVLVAGACGIVHPAAASGGHYGVDDATIADPGRCQVEAWYARADGDNDDLTVMPACNPTGNLELSLGLTRVTEAGDRDTIVEFGVKTLFRELAPGQLAWGIAAVTTWGGALERREGATLYVPASYPMSDTLLLHANAGWSIERDEPNAAVWGIGANYWIVPRVVVITEVYGAHRGGTELQLGVRYEYGPAIFDVGYGRARDDAADDWITIGFAWAF